MKIIAMIPARMGSKRVPKKNIRYLGEKPLIQYPIDLVKGCGHFDELWINTESSDLGHYAEIQGIKFHKRPDELSSDSATNRDFMYEFLKKHECDYVVMVNPTSPLLSSETLENFVNMILEEKYDTILSVVNEKTECYYLGKEVNFDKNYKINSQLLNPVSRVVWALTCWKRSTFILNQENNINPIFAGNVGLYPIPKFESCDIDTEEDWIVAEMGISHSESSNKSPKYLNFE